MTDEKLDEVAERVALSYRPKTLCRAIARAMSQRFPRQESMDDRVLEQAVDHLVVEVENCIRWMTEDQYTAMKSELDYAHHVTDDLKAAAWRVCRSEGEDRDASVERLRELLLETGGGTTQEQKDE